MSRISESSSDSNHFIFFHDYEEESFDEFIGVILKALKVQEKSREFGPYSVLVTVCYEESELILTSGSFEGCFISMDKSRDFLAAQIIEIFQGSTRSGS